MSGQVSRGSAGEYKADEPAVVALLRLAMILVYDTVKQQQKLRYDSMTVRRQRRFIHSDTRRLQQFRFAPPAEPLDTCPLICLILAS